MCSSLAIRKNNWDKYLIEVENICDEKVNILIEMMENLVFNKILLHYLVKKTKANNEQATVWETRLKAACGRREVIKCATTHRGSERHICWHAYGLISRIKMKWIFAEFVFFFIVLARGSFSLLPRCFEELECSYIICWSNIEDVVSFFLVYIETLYN